MDSPGGAQYPFLAALGEQLAPCIASTRQPRARQRAPISVSITTTTWGRHPRAIPQPTTGPTFSSTVASNPRSASSRSRASFPPPPATGSNGSTRCDRQFSSPRPRPSAGQRFVSGLRPAPGAFVRQFPLRRPGPARPHRPCRSLRPSQCRPRHDHALRRLQPGVLRGLFSPLSAARKLPAAVDNRQSLSSAHPSQFIRHILLTKYFTHNSGLLIVVNP